MFKMQWKYVLISREPNKWFNSRQYACSFNGIGNFRNRKFHYTLNLRIIHQFLTHKLYLTVKYVNSIWNKRYHGFTNTNYINGSVSPLACKYVISTSSTEHLWRNRIIVCMEHTSVENKDCAFQQYKGLQ